MVFAEANRHEFGPLAGVNALLLGAGPGSVDKKGSSLWGSGFLQHCKKTI
jgi:hypothetical protein